MKTKNNYNNFTVSGILLEIDQVLDCYIDKKISKREMIKKCKKLHSKLPLHFLSGNIQSKKKD